MSVDMSRFGIGQAVRRVEDQRFLTGAGRYVGDITLPRMAHAAIVYATHAHADIVSIDTSSATAAPGVSLVLTGEDVKAEGIGGLPPYFMPSDMGGPPGYRTTRPILIADRVRCVGDRVALIVADTPEHARAAADLISVEYAPRKAVVTPDAALAPNAPLVWDDCPENTSFHLQFGDRGAVDTALEDAAHVISLRIVNNRITASSIEPRCAVGDYDAAGDNFTLYASSQNPHGMRHQLTASVLRIPEHALRVVSPDVGGGFGMKADPYPEDALVLIAARRLRRPVKWVSTRSEAMAGDNHGRDQIADADLALDANGKALGLRVRATHALGAYVASAAVAPIVFSLRMLPGVYDIPAVFVSSDAVFTNCSPTGPYRGAGRPEACFILERLMDEAARTIGIDQVEIRRRNLIPPTAMPHTTPIGVTYDSGDFPRMMEDCLESSDWSGFMARKAASAAEGLLRGRAISCYVETAGVFNERMEIRFDPEGGVAIVAGTHSHGQGHATVFAQLVHEFLGIDYTNIRFIQGDTDKVPIGRGTYAARSSLLGGTALHAACAEAIRQCRQMAASILEVDASVIEFAAGIFSAANTNKSVSIVDTVKAFFRPIGLPGGLSVGLTCVGNAGGESPNFPNGAHICEVEVCPLTGSIRVDRYTVCDDVGRAINPMICEGQIIGGIAQGLGQAMIEAIRYDEEGQLTSGSFSEYGLMRIDTMPHVKSIIKEIPCLTNPLGVKGVGESGTIGAPPTLVNAVIDALAALGVHHLQMPLTPYAVWDAIQQSRAANGLAA